MKSSNIAIILSCGLLTVACATYTPGTHTPDVATTVESRTGIILNESQSNLDTLSGKTTLADAAKAALTGNPRLIAALEDLNIASADEIQAGLLINPALGGEFVFFDDDTRPNLNFGLGFDIGRIFSRSKRMQVARLDRESVQFEVTALIVGTIFDAQQALLTLWQAEQRLKLFQNALLITKAESDTANLLYSAGNLTAGEIADHIEAYQQASLNAGNAQLAVIEAKQKLATITGVYTDATISADIDPHTMENYALTADFIDQVLTQNIKLEGERKRIEALGARLGLAKISIWIEHLELEALYEREDEGGFGFGATVPLPLFDWGKARTGKATAMLNAAEQRYKALYLSTRNLAEATEGFVQILKEAAGSMNTALLNAAVKKLEFENSRFNAMQIGPFDLLNAKKAYIQTKQRALDIQYLYASTVLKAKALEAGVTVSAAEIRGAANSLSTSNEGDHS